ncbi:universal stress protein [Acidimangrovimonas sediminis]|uniref:universal stress protein n=1 Tax=Acidimangrovimonas sediminis TaxID=2056283 RepID=UPI000C7FF051|nr:universal stress protein [Acidimangrovimonas sediminis]
MFNTIMVPVDLRHAPAQAPAQEKALTIAAELAHSHAAEVVYVGVTSPEPGEVGHNPEEYAARLQDFAQAQSEARSQRARAHVIVAHDPTIDLDGKLTEAAAELGADLVVMATHAPNVTDYIWSGHGAHMAAHAAASVFLVRG